MTIVKRSDEAAPPQADAGLKRSKPDVRLRLAQPFEKAQISEGINLDFPSLFLDFPSPGL